MRLIKIGLAATNPTVGAVKDNTDRLIQLAHEMAEEDVTVACFPEQTIGGYPAEDLVQWGRFVDAQLEALRRFAQQTRKLRTVHVVGLVVGHGGQLFNVAAVVHRGRILGLVPKERLPTYEVFYEARTLSRGTPGLELEVDGIPLGDRIFSFDFGTVAVEVCEDIWTPSGPMRRRCFSGAELVVNLSASPYRVGVPATREEMLATRSADNQVAVAYAPRVGAQDGLVFDGGGQVFQNGRPLLDAPRFEEGWWPCVLDLDRTTRLRRENTTWRDEQERYLEQHDPVTTVRSEAPTPPTDELTYPAPQSDSFFMPTDRRPERSPREVMLDDLYEALSVGVADYYRKTGAFEAMGVAVSGGRDSLLTLLVAHRARQRLEAAGVQAELRAFYMPTRHSLDPTREAARTICKELEVPLVEVPIEEAYDREHEAVQAMLEGGEPSGITGQNIQARLRGQRMWNWANTAQALFLQTGDMTEKAVGYTTIGGDLEGGLSVIANLPKTVVVALLERLEDRDGYQGIAQTLATPATPELTDDQVAEEELMPFEVLDACLHLYAEEKLSTSEVTKALADLFPELEEDELAAEARRFARLFTRSIYKWVQSPLSLHVGTLDLERERALQLPVVQDTQWDDDGG